MLIIYFLHNYLKLNFVVEQYSRINISLLEVGILQKEALNYET